MKKFGIVIATVIVMALTGCSSKEKTTTADKVAVEVSTEATTEEVEVTTEETTEEVIEIGGEKNEKSDKTDKTDKTTESVAQTTAVIPVQQGNSGQSSQTSAPTPKPTQSTQQTTEAPKPTQSTQAPVQQTPVTTEAPAPVHQHTWATRTEIVTDAWTETVEHPAVTHTERHNKCNYCGGFYSDMTAHQESYDETNVEHAIAGWTVSTQTIVDQEAWTETIEHPAVTKTVEYCIECGTTK